MYHDMHHIEMSFKILSISSCLHHSRYKNGTDNYEIVFPFGPK